MHVLKGISVAKAKLKFSHINVGKSGMLSVRSKAAILLSGERFMVIRKLLKD